jgi:hypothetical protein
MSDPFSSDYNSEYDVGLDEDSKPTNDRDIWLPKMTKGQVLRVSFAYFHPVDLTAVNAARAAARKAGSTLSQEQLKSIANKALSDRAAAMNKTVDQLTLVDRLDLGAAHFKRIMASYQQGLGFVINRLGKDGPEADAIWRKIAEPRPYYTTLLFIYPTDRAGNIDKDKLPTAWDLKPWRFGKRVYDDIWKLDAGLRDNNMGLHSQDLKLECTEAQFQNINVSFAGPALWQKSDKFRQIVLSKAVGFYDKLIPFREMTTDQLRAKLGLGGPVASDVSVSVDASDFASILDKV